MPADLQLILSLSTDIEDGVARLDPVDMRLLGLQPKDVMGISGQRTSFAHILPARMEDRNQRLVSVHPRFAENIGAKQGDKVRVMAEKITPAKAESIMVYAQDDIDRLYLSVRLEKMAETCLNRVVVDGDKLCLPTLDRHPLSVQVKLTKPAGRVQIAHSTVFTIAADAQAEVSSLGGLRDVYRACESLVRARFEKNRSVTPSSALLFGPVGCGKALLVRKLARALDAALEIIDAHYLIDRWIACGGEALPLLADLSRRGPTIILLDHLEALSDVGTSDANLAPRGALAQIGALLDEAPLHHNLFVFGITSGSLHPRFRDHQAFDVQLPVDAPNRLARHEILHVATQDLPLCDDVELGEIATMTPGATARDLKQLVSAAAHATYRDKIEMSDFIAALRSLSLSAINEVRCDVPTTPWNDVAGLDEIKQLMRETVAWSQRYHGKFDELNITPPRSVLLSGAPGTGKTSLVRALAGFMPMNFIEVACPLLAAYETQEAVRYIRSVFAMARRKTPCLIFFDDIDALFDIGGAHQEMPHLHPIVAQLLAELNDTALLPGIVVIAATNRPDRLTPEVLRPGRFDYAVTLPMPDINGRKKILQIHARKLPLASDVDFDRLAAVTQGMSSSEIANLCSRVGLMALRQSINASDAGVMPPVVNAELFEQCLRGRKS